MLHFWVNTLRGLFSACLLAMIATYWVNSAQATEIKNWSPGLTQKLSGISSEYVVLQVWSPFCEPCSEEVKELNAVLKTVNQSRARLSALGIPVQSRDKEIRAFIEYFRPQYEQWLPDSAFSEAFAKGGTVPWTLLLGRVQGAQRPLLREWRGKVSASQLISAVAQADAAKKGNP